MNKFIENAAYCAAMILFSLVLMVLQIVFAVKERFDD